MRRLFFQFAALAAVLSVNFATAAMSPEEYTESVFRRFVSYYDSGIDEKLYLQTDKPYYSAGEHIWIKGYLLNAITHAPIRFSNFVYVELADEKSTLVSRVKIQRDSLSGFNGYMPLDANLRAGKYTLSAYTRWMTNKSQELFFKKVIEVISPVPINVAADDAAASGEALSKREISRAESEQAKLLGETKALEQKRLDYKVQFFPEGGALLSGAPHKVAFKAVAEDGYSTEVTGKIYNAQEAVVTEFKSAYKGMGSFVFIAESNQNYYAMVESEEGELRRFDLPVSEDVGVALKVQRVGNRLLYQILASSKLPLRGAHVVIHSRGRILTALEAQADAVKYISMDLLYDGISVVSLVDKDNNILSERLVFKKPQDSPQLTIRPTSSNYAARSKATVVVSVADAAGDPIAGEYAVSVTDNSSIEPDPAHENIYSYMLLSSELKGFVEDPGLYFSDNTAALDNGLDLLMLTQGWRRFNLTEVLNGTVPKPTVKYEDLARISGNVKGYFGNSARKPKIFVLCSSVNYADAFDLDEYSTFNLLGLNIPDSVTYIIQTRGKNGGGNLKLNIDEEKFPVVNNKILVRHDRSLVPVSFLNQSQDKFYYEGGIRNIDLEAVSVTTEGGSKGSTAGFATQGSTRADLDDMDGMMLSDIIMTYPSMSIDMAEGYVYYRGGTEYVRFMVNGIDDEFDNVKNITSDQIEQIDFYYGTDAVMFTDAAGGVFCITLRQGAVIDRGNLPNIAYIRQLGYQTPVEFYQPSYDSPNVRESWPPDYRTTVYWNSKLAPDVNGNIMFNFFTADKATTYTITVEGVTEEGKICRGTEVMERTKAN
ncbi:MAG: MG2 domain-containing protein [Rikenellaceae bacterium]